MFMRSHVARIPTLRDDAGLGPDGTVGVELMATVRFVVILALSALEAGVRLGADANALSGFDEGHFGADAEGLAYNFCERFSVSSPFSPG